MAKIRWIENQTRKGEVEYIGTTPIGKASILQMSNYYLLTVRFFDGIENYSRTTSLGDAKDAAERMLPKYMKTRLGELQQALDKYSESEY